MDQFVKYLNLVHVYYFVLKLETQSARVPSLCTFVFLFVNSRDAPNSTIFLCRNRKNPERLFARFLSILSKSFSSSVSSFYCDRVLLLQSRCLQLDGVKLNLLHRRQPRLVIFSVFQYARECLLWIQERELISMYWTSRTP